MLPNFRWTSESKRCLSVVARVICNTTSYRARLDVISILNAPIYPGVHGRLRRACKGHREYMMFIDGKHTMQV